MGLLGYARVSTSDQSVVGQIDALGAAGCERVWTGTASGLCVAARGVAPRSLAEQIATTSATGRLVLQVFGALAEFERGLNHERGHEVVGVVPVTRRPRPQPGQDQRPRRADAATYNDQQRIRSSARPLGTPR